ncbi:MAG TPA: hypothetical protein VMN60_00170 [Longimicrobiales bacterium]|nr:hypothetical protein [Longimicrobiales bacterium]
MPPFTAARTLKGAPATGPVDHAAPAAPGPTDLPMPWEVGAAGGSAPAVAQPYPWTTGGEVGAAVPAWQSEGDEGAEAMAVPPPAAEFPLDAFIIPEDARRLPTGYELEHDEAERLAERLEQLARQVRTRGIAALGSAPGSDDLSRVIASAIVAHFDRAD